MRKIELLIVICVFQGLASLGLFAQPVATQIDSTTIITFIGHLNSDNVADTLYNKVASGTYCIPAFIRWGMLDSNNSNSYQTTFYYPQLSDLRTTYCVQRFDDDSLSDILMTIRGRKPDTIKIDSIAYVDTAFAIAILGGHGLDTTQIAYLAILPPGTQRSFSLINLRIGTHLVDPIAIYSNSEPMICYKVKGVVTPPAGGGAQRRSTNQVAENESNTSKEITINVYPNPVSENATIAFNNIPEGEYRISVLDMKGDEKFSGTKKVANGGEIVQKIELSNLPDGVYFISVASAEGVIGTYKIIILH